MLNKPRLSTPYYMHGRGAQSWHTNRAENAGATAAVLGGVSVAARHPKSQEFIARNIESRARMPHQSIQPGHMRLFSHGAAAAGGLALAYGGYHAYRAHEYKKRRESKAKKKSGRK